MCGMQTKTQAATLPFLAPQNSASYEKLSRRYVTTFRQDIGRDIDNKFKLNFYLYKNQYNFRP